MQILDKFNFNSTEFEGIKNRISLNRFVCGNSYFKESINNNVQQIFIYMLPNIEVKNI